ncbi:MAG: hypothetical protein ABI573_06820 [Chloroflexota bacterium]
MTDIKRIEPRISRSCSGEIVLRAEDIPGSDGIESIQGATLDGQSVLFIESLVGQGTDIWLATVSVGY